MKIHQSAPKRKMLSTTVYFTPLQKSGLIRVREATGISEARLVREGLDIILKIYQERLEKLGLFKDQDNRIVAAAVDSVGKFLEQGMRDKHGND